MKFCHKIVLVLSALICSTTASAAVYTQVKVVGTASNYDCDLSGLNCATLPYPVSATFNFGADSTSFFDGFSYGFLTGTDFSGGVPSVGRGNFDFVVNFPSPINLSLIGQNITLTNPTGSFSELVGCGGGRSDCTIFGSVLYFNLRTSGTSFGPEGTTWSYTDATPRSAAPEPAAWMTMVVGFGAAGFALRRRRSLRMAMAA